MLWGLGAAAVIAVFVLLYARLPWWIDGTRLHTLVPKDQAAVLSSDRGDVLKMVAGAGALVALIYTARKHALDRAGQVTDRYSRAIAHLASQNLEERIGGIYALERIMADSRRDHPTVVEVLAAFVRERAPRAGQPAHAQSADERAVQRTARMRARANLHFHAEALPPVRLAADVQAAMTVLARRPKRSEPFTLDLRHTNLAGLELPRYARLARADLTDADLTRAQLFEANLTRATLTMANLSEAMLPLASLAEARLVEANLTAAGLMRANLTGVWLRGADLTASFLSEAALTGARLDGANLTGAFGLTAEALASTHLTKNTRLAPSLATDPWIQARINDCAAAAIDEINALGLLVPPRTPAPQAPTPEQATAVQQTAP